MTDLELTAPPEKRKPVRGHSTLRDKLRSNHSDHFQTPPEAIEYLLPFIPKDRIVWDPACGKGNIIRAFKAHGYGTAASDIGPPCCRDFFSYRSVESSLIQVTNPPYSRKTAWVEQSYELEIPFALLMPLTALEGRDRQRCYKQHGLQLMILPRRINFETPNMGKLGSGSHFATAWYCWKLNLPSDLYFAPELKP